jgi:hypothetical protein
MLSVLFINNGDCPANLGVTVMLGNYGARVITAEHRRPQTDKQ